MSTAPAAQPLAGPVHVVGIGGAGMSGIARILLARGVTVSGSDAKDSRRLSALRALGATVHVGHAAAHVAGAAVVVVSTAIKESNVELLEARRRGVPVLSRAAALAAIMAGQRGVAVAGTHGKTTTTSMLTVALQHCGADPSFAIGSELNESGSNAHLGTGELFVVEADESDGSFLHLAPIIAVITNVDREHLDHYHSDQEIEDAFVAFANKVPFYGSAIVCIDDPVLRRLIPQMTRRVRTYGASPDADLVIGDISHGRMVSHFTLTFQGASLGAFEVHGAGRHNVLNAAAAALVGLELGATAEQIREGLRGFIGVDRRFQIRGERGGVTVVDDYGHHPTEIRATLSAARNCGFERIHVIFQPHRYSRTELLEAEFAACFGDCNTLEVVDIYAASEEPRPGVNSVRLSEKIRAAGAVAQYAPSIEEAVERVTARARPGDAIVTLGAGNIFRAGEAILAALHEVEEGAPR